MSSKESSPSPSLGSRFSLESLRGKQHSIGSISIRFNAASMQEEEDDDDILGQDSCLTSKPSAGALKLNVKPVSVIQKNPKEASKNGELDSVFRVSRSAPVSEVVTPVSDVGDSAATTPLQPSSDTFHIFSRNESKSEPEKSIFSGLREKLQDPIAFIEKMAAESPIIESIDRRLRKQDSLDTTPRPVKSTSGSNLADKLAGSRAPLDLKKIPSADDVKMSLRTRHASVDNEMICPKGGDDLNVNYGIDKGHSRSNSIDIVDDFFQVPAHMTLDSSTSKSLSKLSSTDSLEDGTDSKKLNTLQKLRIKSKSKGVSDRPVSVSLSGLLHNRSEDDLNKLDDDLFYDPNEDASPAIKREKSLQSVKQADPPSGLNKTEIETESQYVYKMPTKQKTIAALVAVLAYIVIPMPSYIAGMVFGAMLATCFIYLYQWWTAPSKPRPVFVLPELSTLPPLKVPEMRESKNEDGKFKGWLNEIAHYEPDNYHINLTHSIYITLEKTTLRIQIPKQSIPKRAMWDETISVSSFVSQRYFDLLGCTVLLLPNGLVKKRLWSKKYPICLIISKAKSRFVKDTEEALVKEDVLSTSKLTDMGSNIEQRAENTGAEDNQHSAEGSEKGSGTAICPGPDSPGIMEMGFESVGDKPNSSDIRLYLFGRTGREKEEWYRRFVAASQGNPYPTRLSDIAYNLDSSGSSRTSLTGTKSKTESNEEMRHKREGSSDSNVSDTPMNEIYKQTPEQVLSGYLGYMAKIMPNQAKAKARSKSPKPTGSQILSEKPVPVICEPQALWANALIGRLFWDMLRQKYWNDKIQEKIQKKLSKIHVPYFIDELTVTGIELGAEVPIIRRASQPYLDDRGLWIDLDIAYSGGFCMSLETKCNLMKLKKQSRPEAKFSLSQDQRSPILDSDEEDSAESSTDEEGEENVAEITDDSSPVRFSKFKKNLQALKIKKTPKSIAKSLHTPQSTPVGGTSNTSKKILRIVDKIAQSKYFQQATEYKYIKKAMEEVSNLRLILNVELKSLVGTLSVNIPPPPTDRIWYGFRNNPHLWLSAKPRVGQREVNVSHITDWIEKKLAIEFQRVFVMPNMDDLPIPLMCDHLAHNQSTYSSDV